MSTTVTFNGTSYTVPALADASWGTNVSNYLIAIATGCLQKTGGTFTLTAEVNFGATYGIKAARLKSQTTNIAAAGFIWLAKTDTINWRNNANDGDLPLGIDSSNRLTFNSLPITSLALGAADTVLRMNSAGTATEYAKLVAANLSATAAIADTQLATIATALKVSNSATTAASANTASAIVARDGSGNFTAGTITASLTGSISGNAATVTTNANLTGPVTSSGNATAIADGALALAKLATTTAGFFPVGAVTTGIPTYVALSGDATLASTGALTLATVPVGKGGTGVTGASTGSVGVVLSTSPTITTPSIVTSETYRANAEIRFNNSGNTFYTGFKGGESAANKIWTLPLVDGSANQLLGTDGSATLIWVSPLTNPMTTAQDMIVGGASGTATRLATALLGDVKVLTPLSASYAVTSASPGVFTVSAHGMATGDKAYVTVTQNGFTANTTYYVSVVSSSTFKLSTTFANASAGTGITSSGTVAGVIVSGGLTLSSGTRGTVTNDTATAGYVGEIALGTRLFASTTALTTATGKSLTDTGTLQPGDYLVSGAIHYETNATGTLTVLDTAFSVTDNTSPATSTIGAPNSSGEFRSIIQSATALPFSEFTSVIPAFRFSIATGTTSKLYLVAKATFTGGAAVTGSGFIQLSRFR